jgi:hypothetical protein
VTDGTPIVAIDFDGTIVDHRFPAVGAPVPLALQSIRALIAMRWRVILWTMRSGKHLDEAVAFLKRHGIEPWAVNSNPTQAGWTSSPKAYAHYYVDDAAIGCPVKRFDGFARPAVDWHRVGHMLLERELGPGARLLVAAEERDAHDLPAVVRRAPDRQPPRRAVRVDPDGGAVARPVLPARKPRKSRP